jgi:beta-galactosidase
MSKNLVLGGALLATGLTFARLSSLGEDPMSTNSNSTGRIVGTLPLATSRPRISLDGEWSLRYDPGYTLATTKSFEQKWYQRDVKFPDVTQVPGCWHYKTGKHCDSYGSVVWFKKTFPIPATWTKGRIWLQIGGVKPSADIWLNDAHLGFTLSSRSPIKLDISDLVRRGEENTLALCVSYPDVRLDGVWDWGEGEQVWDGIYRSVFIEQTPDVWIDDIHVQTAAARRTAQVNLAIGGKRDAGVRSAKCTIRPWKGEGAAYTGDGQIGSDAKGALSASVDVDMKGARLWSPADPYLYVAQTTLLDAGGNVVDEASVRFGLREISTKGTQILLNGQPIFLRGACDDQSYPESFCPPNSKEFFLKRIKLAQEYGFNYTKSCVEVFTQEFLDAADEAGYLVCQEMPFGVDAKRNIRYNPPPAFETLYREEAANIVRSDRHHPSIVIYSMSSEIWDGDLNQKCFRIFGQDLPRITRQLNPTALVIDCTGGFPREIKTKYGERVSDLESLFDTGRPCNELPYIFHEWHWITSLPDPKIKARYRDLPIKPTGVLRMEAAAAKSGLTDELPLMVANSQKLKGALRKAALEYARKTPGAAGYHHWLIHDINWCPEGVFNEFWERPESLTAEEFRTYNADTVLLLKNPMSIYEGVQACYVSGQELEAPILVSHYGAEPLAAVTLDWTVSAAGQVVLKGQETTNAIACGTCVPVGCVKGKLPAWEKAGGLTIEAVLRTRDGNLVNRNRWTIWGFPEGMPDLRGRDVTSNLPFLTNACPGVGAFDPAQEPHGSGLLVTDALRDSVLRHLENGGRVLLLSAGAALSGLPDSGPRCTEYRTIPYNSGDAGNMGTVIYAHPALAAFPHEGWCDLQFFCLVQGYSPFDLGGLRPAKLHPLVRSNGSYTQMQDKAYLFEAEIGKGKLMASSFGIAPTFAGHPETRFLLSQLLEYCCSERFAPRDKLAPEILRALLQKRSEGK